MAAPMRITLQRHRVQGHLLSFFNGRSTHQPKPAIAVSHFVRNLSWKHGCRGGKIKICSFKVVVGSVAVATAALAYRVLTNSNTVKAESPSIPEHRISRSICVPSDSSGLRLTLYQYQSCPFCCKVRAFLDYNGLSYDIVEVNSVFKTQLKWSEYKKVPVLVAADRTDKGYLQMRDSSVIISLLDSHLVDPTVSLEKLHSYYPGFYGKNEKGKMAWDFPNRYFIMFGDGASDGRTEKQRSTERKWRQWTDDHLVHMLSPNVYRTPAEAIQAFNYFSEVGRWEENFSTPSRLFVIYTGAAVMFIIGKLLKKKYALKDDVRESLYDACNDWLKMIGPKNRYHGGDEASLADLSVYGVLSSIEGCDAFQDLLKNTQIGDWYYRMKNDVDNHIGARK